MPIDSQQSFFELPAFRKMRVHEAAGPARESFALCLAGYLKKDFAWIGSPDFRLNPFHLQSFIEPERLFQIKCSRHEDRLWVMEEALRSKSFGLVVADVLRPLSFLEGRRLQLAAQAGQMLGLCLIRDSHGSNTAETRWYCEPAYSPSLVTDSTHWYWHLKKNKTGTNGSWEVGWNAKTRHVSLVSTVAGQPLDAQGAG